MITLLSKMPERSATYLRRDTDRLELPMPTHHIPCSVEGCAATASVRGLCPKHYTRWHRHGDPLVARHVFGTRAEQFWAKVDKNGPVPEHRPDLGSCWLWMAYRLPNGYGKFGGSNNPPILLAHHFLVGKPTAGFEWDHLCEVHHCVRPEHLELVTHAENVARSNRWHSRRSET